MNFISNLRIFTRRPIVTPYCLRAFSIESENVNTATDNKVGGYAKAFDKFEQINTEEPEKPQTFASLLRNSKFIDVSLSLCHSQSSNSVFTAWRSCRKSCYWKDISCNSRWFVYWFWLEISLCLCQTHKESKVRWSNLNWSLLLFFVY